MRIEYYQVNAFTQEFNGGNPAAVCPLNNSEWLDDTILQAIAKENNFSETAFYIRNGDEWDLRWFTPGTEVDLCGHATLATAAVIRHKTKTQETIHFNTKSGRISVFQQGERLCLDMPIWSTEKADLPQSILDGLGSMPSKILKSNYYLLVYDNDSTVRELNPDFSIINKMDLWGMVVTASADKNKDIDFVSRFFGNESTGIDEDPVTGSAHCILTPYWAKELGKNKLKATQVSSRAGDLQCELTENRVLVSGHAVMYAEGFIYI